MLIPAVSKTKARIAMRSLVIIRSYGIEGTARVPDKSVSSSYLVASGGSLFEGQSG